MLSVANLETYKLSKDQMNELIKYVVEPDTKSVGSKTKSSKLSGKSSKSDSKSGKKGHKKDKETSVKLLKIMSQDDFEDTELGILKFMCCCSGRGRKPSLKLDQQTLLNWRNKYCRTFEEFLALMTKTTDNSKLSIPGFNDIKRELSYEDDPTAPGLSKLGALMWMLTYGVQHLIDPAKTSTTLAQALVEIRSIYQDIGSSAQRFLMIAEKFNNRMQEIHEIVCDLVKRLVKKYKLGKDPRQLRPEYKPTKASVRRRIGYPNATTGIGRDTDEEEDELFCVNWSPLTITVQYPNSNDWEIFGQLPLDERLSVFKILLQFALNLLEDWIHKFNDATGYTSSSSGTVGKSSSTEEAQGHAQASSKSPLFQVTNAMNAFVTNNNKNESADPIELDHIKTMVEDFWLTMDSLYEVSFEIIKLIQETREVVRVCYTYATTFYQWKLASFDSFDPQSKTKERREAQKTHRAALAKILGQRRFSDASMFISLAEFTSSIYQNIGRKHPVQANGYSIKLDCWEDEEVETWGLVADANETISSKST